MMNGRIVEVHVTRHTVNVTKGRASLWPPVGDWPDARYFLMDRRGRRIPECLRFADEGDVVECVVLKTYTMDYHGLRWHKCRRTVERVVRVQKGATP